MAASVLRTLENKETSISLVRGRIGQMTGRSVVQVLRRIRGFMAGGWHDRVCRVPPFEMTYATTRGGRLRSSQQLVFFLLHSDIQDKIAVRPIRE